ncbi:MAG: hypothetical protein DI498_10860 [Paracoccus denitrificans]|nr:MAG: hypothetical protein DI498_10860 [Paracoccus denitrificans]PZO83643.1 MAG: hypothetical protein DI633_10860 [Paracoccus denitrificans]
MIHARAWAMVEKVFDNVPERIVLLHAATMLKASLAYCQPDPVGALAAMLSDDNHAASEILRDAMSAATMTDDRISQFIRDN